MPASACRPPHSATSEAAIATRTAAVARSTRCAGGRRLAVGAATLDGAMTACRRFRFRLAAGAADAPAHRGQPRSALARAEGAAVTQNARRSVADAQATSTPRIGATARALTRPTIGHGSTWHRNWIVAADASWSRPRPRRRSRDRLEAPRPRAASGTRAKQRRGARAVARSGRVAGDIEDASGARSSKAIDELAHDLRRRDRAGGASHVSTSAIGATAQTATDATAGARRTEARETARPDAFLKLLVDAAAATRIRSSRRTNGEFIAQLAQFSSLEQLTAIADVDQRHGLGAPSPTLAGTARHARRPALHRQTARRHRAAPPGGARTWQSDPFRPACRASTPTRRT